MQVGTPLGLGLGFGLVLGLGSGWDDLDDHFRRLQPIDLNLDILGTTHLIHENRVSILYPSCLFVYEIIFSIDVV